MRTIQHSATNFGRFGLIRSALAVALSGVLFVTSAGAFLYRALAGQVQDRVIDINSFVTNSSDTQTPDSFEGRAVNVLVLGIDSREGKNSDLGAGDSEDVGGLRNDSTMVVHISADRTRLQVLSIPRDTLVDIPSCRHADNTSSAPQTDVMFNTSMFTGANGGADASDVAPGVACVKATVEQMSGMALDAFMVVDFAGFISMVDALGGVWFNIPEDIADDDAGLYIDQGCWKLGGTHALAYMRARYSLEDGTDISRIGRQQQLISAIMRELQSKNYVTDLPSLVSFLQAAIATVNISSNLADPMADATLLVNLMSKLDRANMQFVTLPVVAPPWDENRRIAAEPLASKVWQAIEDDQALPVGTEYTDGNGAHLTVPDPNAGSSSAPGAGDSSQGQGASPSAPGQGAAPSNPGQGSEDSTSSQTDVAQANNSAEAEAKNQVDTCPPADKR